VRGKETPLLYTASTSRGKQITQICALFWGFEALSGRFRCLIFQGAFAIVNTRFTLRFHRLSSKLPLIFQSFLIVTF
jgi:hypothetical protein